MDTTLKIGGSLLMLATVAGCGGSDDLSSRVPNGSSPNPIVFDDGESVGLGQQALQVSHELRGVNSAGDAGVVRVSWSLTASGEGVLRSNSQVRLREFNSDQPGKVLASQRVSSEEPSGSFDVPVDTESDVDTSWYLELDRADLTAVPGVTHFSVVNLESILKRNTTPLERLDKVKLSLVEDSYTAENIGNRREHNFSVSVAGELRVEGDSSGNTRSVFVTGLVSDVEQPFLVRESDIHESESPLTVTDVRKDPLVYLVMDASSSMLDNECADDLYHAVSSTVITLAPSVNFEYRIFDNEVYRVDSTLEFLPIAGEASGSALYYALDTVVADIEQWENPDRDIFIIAYSDGLDLASWNHYDFASRDAVVSHVGRRLSGLAQQHQQFNGRSLRTFLVGFDPMSGSEAEEMLFLATQGGGEYVQMSRGDCNASVALQNSNNDVVKDKIVNTFLSLTENIRSVYHMNYSSQQTHGHTTLSLELNLSELVNDRLYLPERPVE